MTTLPVDWYAARAAGIVAYVLLSAGVLLGVALAGRARLQRWPAFAVADVHRFLGLLTGLFLAIHVGAIALDTYTRFSLAQLVVPGASTYRPLWVALGIVSAELLVAIAAANALRRRMRFTLWRRVHYLTFLVWAGATVHGLGAGTDAGAAWSRALYLVSIASVLAAVAWRVARTRSVPAFAAAGAVAAVLVAGLGTSPHVASTAPLPRSASAAFSGTISQQRGPGGALVSAVGRGGALRFRVDVLTPDGRTITDTSVQVREGARGAVCTGTLASIDATGFRGTCSLPGGATRSVAVSWRTAGQGVSGTLRVTA